MEAKSRIYSRNSVPRTQRQKLSKGGILARASSSVKQLKMQARGSHRATHDPKTTKNDDSDREWRSQSTKPEQRQAQRVFRKHPYLTCSPHNPKSVRSRWRGLFLHTPQTPFPERKIWRLSRECMAQGVRSSKGPEDHHRGGQILPELA